MGPGMGMGPQPPMPPGGAPGGAPGGKPTIGGTMDSMRSPFNPTDLAAMQQNAPPKEQGMQMLQQMTVRQVMEQQGVDVDGPAIQLVELMKKQQANADPKNKMMAMGQAAPEPNPMDAKMKGMGGGPGMPPGGAPGGPPQQGGDIESLMRMKGGM